jgi:hypothetical protein
MSSRRPPLSPDRLGPPLSENSPFKQARREIVDLSQEVVANDLSDMQNMWEDEAFQYLENIYNSCGMYDHYLSWLDGVLLPSCPHLSVRAN